MRRIILAFAGTVSGLILLFSYPTSTAGVVAAGEPSTTDAVPAPSTGTPTPAPSTPESDSEASTGDGTFTGDSVNTRWGPVQVQITVQGGRITDVTVLQYPDENHRDVEINNYALPILEEDVLASQSADLDHVSGATVTVEGYVESLQSALDQAQL